MQNSFKSKNLIYLSIFILAACQSTSTSVDYNPETNFSQFNQFQFKQSADAIGSNTDPLTGDRIKEAITANLLAKSLSTSAESELHVSYHTTLEQKENKSSFSIGLGGSNRSGSSSTGVGLGTTVPLDSTYDVYTKITIDFYHQGKLIWRGFDGFELEQGASPEEKHNGINNTVNTILSNFPPK